MSLFHMDKVSDKYLHDYAQLMTKKFVQTPHVSFSFTVGVDFGSEVPTEGSTDIITCSIVALVLKSRADGLPGKDVVVTFNSFCEGDGVNHMMNAHQVVDGQDLEVAKATPWMTNGDKLYCKTPSNEVILGHFEKLGIPEISAFTDLKNEMADTGFYLYRDGFTPPDDEDLDEDEDHE